MYIAGDYRHREENGIQNGSEPTKAVQKPSKIMKILKIGSERSPRDKSGAFGFENMFWPLGNVARPEAYTGGHAGVQGVSMRVWGSWGLCVMCMHPVAPCTYVAPVSSLYI